MYFCNEWSSQLEIAEPDTFNLCSIKRIVMENFLSLIFSVVLFVIIDLLFATRDQSERANEIAVLSTVATIATNRTASKFGRVHKL